MIFMSKRPGRLLAGASALALLVGLGGEARANFYAYSVQQTSGYTFTGATVGTIALGSLGGGELELEAQNGALVPAIVSGDMVTVSNGAAVILAIRRAHGTRTAGAGVTVATGRYT